MSKHRADPTARPRRTARGILGATGGVAAAVLVALAATGGTYAMWNDARTINPGQVTSGHTALTINNVTNYSITGLDVTKLYPGRSVITTIPLAVKNTGITPLAVTNGGVTITDPSGTLATQLVVAIRQAATCTLTAVGGTPVTLTTPIALSPNQTTTVCVEVQLKSTAPANVQGNAASFSIRLDAVQVHP